MTKTEMCRKVTGLSDGNRRTLVYCLTDEEEEPARYGVSILMEESSKETEVRRLSNDKERVEKLLDLLATNFITPSSINDVVYKWLSTL